MNVNADSLRVVNLSPTTPSENPEPKSVHLKIWPYALLLLACIVLGQYCVRLNQELYQHQRPFYDSLSYNNRLFMVMEAARHEGIAKALEIGCFTNSTNCLPFVIAAFLGPFLEADRSIGVWIQTGLYYCFLASLYYFLSRCRGFSIRFALMICAIFGATKCLYLPNGGLSDFRMDLSLYLTFATTVIWYFVSVKQKTRFHFLMLGASAAIACLCRATAPVYLLLALMPLLIFDWMRSHEKRDLLKGIGLAFMVVGVAAGWFYLANFEYLKYYYVFWNTDANAKIPFQQALIHFDLAQGFIGKFVFALLVCYLIAVLHHSRKSNQLTSWVPDSISDRTLDWRFAWVGLAPVLFMVVRRAGLNPYVDMPAIFGIILFLSLPLVKQVQRLAVLRLEWFCWLMLGLAVGLAAFRGWHRHTEIKFDTMASNRQILETIIDDCRARNDERTNYAVLHLSDLNTDSLCSTMIYDCDWTRRSSHLAQIDGVTLSPLSTFSLPAAADWEQVDGTDDQEKIAALVNELNRMGEYVVVPDKSTAQSVQSEKRFNFINRYVVPIRNDIVNDPTWKLVGAKIQTDPNEFVEIYRKTLPKQYP